MTSARARQRPTSSTRLRAIAATSVFAALAAGCSGSGGDGKAAGAGSEASSGPSVSASASATAGAQGGDQAEVRAVYDRYWSELSAAYAKADPKDTALKEVASEAVYVQKDLEVARLRQVGQVVTGATLHSDTSVTFSVTLREGQEIPTAEMTDCVDVSRWRAADRNTGEAAPLPGNRLLKYKAGVTFEKGSRGWMIVGDRMLTQEC